MKIKVLEYQRHKGSLVKVKSHKKLKNGEWKVNPKFEFHKMLIRNSFMYEVLHKKEYTEEVKD